jgi:hypothetical protein
MLSRLATAALVALSVGLVSGCERHYEFPNVLYPPTVVGVIETASLDGCGWHVTLADGRVRDLLEVMKAHEVAARSRAAATAGGGRGDWWSYRDSNPGPPACHAGALPAEL